MSPTTALPPTVSDYHPALYYSCRRDDRPTARVDPSTDRYYAWYCVKTIQTICDVCIDESPMTLQLLQITQHVATFRHGIEVIGFKSFLKCDTN